MWKVLSFVAYECVQKKIFSQLVMQTQTLKEINQGGFDIWPDNSQPKQNQAVPGWH